MLNFLNRRRVYEPKRFLFQKHVIWHWKQIWFIKWGYERTKQYLPHVGHMCRCVAILIEK